jgi:hypothetical protein
VVGASAALALAAGLSLVGVALARPVDDAEAAYKASAAERDLQRLLSSASENGPFVFHVRPGGAAEREGRAALAERLGAALGKAASLLSWKPEKKLHVYLYESPREFAELTGRPAREAAAIAGALHLPHDKDGKVPIGEALARLVEPAWGRAGEKPGAGLEGGRWHRLKVAARGGEVRVALDDKKLTPIPVPPFGAGMIGFGVEEGRIGVRALKLRAAPADPDAASDAPWVHPLRPPADKGWLPEVAGRFRIADEEIEGVRYGRMTRIRFGGQQWKELELECEVRLSEGATGEVTLQAASGPGNRIQLGPTLLSVLTTENRRRPLTGPAPVMREAFAAAIGAELDGLPLHALARAVVDRGLAPLPAAGGLLRGGFPSSTTDRLRRTMLLGSFVAWSLETHGPAKYRDLHFANLIVEPSTPLGDVAALEGEWRKFLQTRKLEAKERRSAERALGLDVMADVSGWRDVSAQVKAGKAKLEGPGRLDGALAQSGTISWTGTGAGTAKVALPVGVAERAVIRLELRLGEGSRARLVVADREGRQSQLVLSSSGAQLLTPERSIAARSAFPLEEGRDYEVALVLEGEAGRVYVDGMLAAEAGSGLSAGPGSARLEMEGRRVDASRILVKGAD